MALGYLDTKDVEIYVTGSSAKLLSKEISTSLRGRSLSVEIQPYNFIEYLDSQSIPLPSKPFGKKILDSYRFHLLGFFQKGGFPGIQALSTHERLETLQNYVEVVVFRDIVERHKVSNIKLLKYFVNVLLKNAASRFSINKFYKYVTSQGHKVGKDTLYSYLEYLEDAFVIFAIPMFTESVCALETTPKKIYAVDNGLINAYLQSFSKFWKTARKSGLSRFAKAKKRDFLLQHQRRLRNRFYYKRSWRAVRNDSSCLG
jgi:predicted AAA+ superfamily ATPase